MDRRRTRSNLAFILAILLLVLVFLYSGLRILESTVFSKGNTGGESRPSKTITRDGVDYFPRQDITVMMLMGIDKFGPVEASGSYNNDGLADVVSLLILDEKDKTATVLCLNRDTMLEMPVLGIGGKPAGTSFGQLALAHTYGSGLKDSCENTRKAVSDLLYGISIDYYVSMNMDALAILNDVVGGVTVTVKDDFSAVDSTIVKGEMTLTGDQALTFVRTRKGVADQMNVSRMERQEEYMHGFYDALQTKLDSGQSFVAKAYEDVAGYIVTDCSLNTLSSLMNRYADYTLKEVVSPEGENVMGEEYMEFHLDEDKLDELILRLFYAPK